MLTNVLLSAHEMFYHLHCLVAYGILRVQIQTTADCPLLFHLLWLMVVCVYSWLPKVLTLQHMGLDVMHALSYYA